jgi:hypothetical protein
MSSTLTFMAAVVAMCGLALVPAPPGQQPPPLPPGWTIASAVKPSPPEVPPAGCRCDILEKKLAALTDRLDRLERQLGSAGGGRDDAHPRTDATPATFRGHFEAPIRSMVVDGRVVEWRKRCDGTTCHWEYR